MASPSYHSHSYDFLTAGAGALETLDYIPSTEAWGEVTIVSPTVPTQVFIGGVLYEESVYTEEGLIGGIRSNTFQYDANLNSGKSVTFEIYWEGGPIPQPGEIFERYVRGVKRFGGLIKTVSKESVPANPDHMILRVECGGFELYCTRRVVANLYTIPMGGIAGILIYVLWQTYLQQYGVTKEGDLGPDILIGDQLFFYETVLEAFNRIVDQTPGWSWWITDDNELKYENTSEKAPDAPFQLACTVSGKQRISTIGESADSLVVHTSNVKFANRVYVVPSGDLKALRTDTAVGDSSRTAFATQYNLQAAPIVRVNGESQLVTELGTWPVGYQFYFIKDGIGVFQNPADPPLTASDTIEIIYPNPFPLAAIAEDLDSIEEKGLYEFVYHAKNATTWAAATAIAEGLLSLMLAEGEFQDSIEFTYNSMQQPEWLHPGDVIHVSWLNPDIEGDFLVEQVSVAEQELHEFRFSVTLRKSGPEITEDRAMQEFLRASRLPVLSPPQRIELRLAIDVVNFTNPGFDATEPILQTMVFQESGVFSFWSALWSEDPPTGADIIVDALLNGVSIFPTDKQMRARAGVTTEQISYEFSEPNLEFQKGDVLSFRGIQGGTVNKGTNGVFYIGTKQRQATS